MLGQGNNNGQEEGEDQNIKHEKMIWIETTATIASNLLSIASNLLSIASNLLSIASNLSLMASKMAFNPLSLF
jgi:hypothetical protein